MVLVISEFKVANGMQAAVRQAFLDRPHLVDEAPGFLGMEVLVSRQDDSSFHLLTRWVDEESFRAWHSSPLHKSTLAGIPKGLKLDASFTNVRVLDVLPCGNEQNITAAADPLIAELPRFLARSRSLHWLKASLQGHILTANPAFELLLQESSGALAGQSVWDRLTDGDAASARTILASERPRLGAPVLLNFVDRDHNVHTLECYLEVHGENFVLVGEPVRQDEEALAKELLELNNRWALLVRENEKNVKALRQSKADLEKAMADLNQSHWHIRKIQETLPICLHCGKVKTADAKWEELVEYIKANSLFLSHGYCPECFDKVWPPAGEGGSAEG